MIVVSLTLPSRAQDNGSAPDLVKVWRVSSGTPNASAVCERDLTTTRNCAKLTVFVGVPGSLCQIGRITLFPILTTLPKRLTHVVDGGGEEVRPEKLVSVQVVRQTPAAAASADNKLEQRGEETKPVPVSVLGARHQPGGYERYRET